MLPSSAPGWPARIGRVKKWKSWRPDRPPDLTAAVGQRPLPRRRKRRPSRAHAVVALVSSGGVTAGHRVRKLDAAEAFVLAHAVAGVLRGLLAAGAQVQPEGRQQIEDALLRLVLAYMEPAPAG